MGEETDVIVGRPYRDEKGVWHKYGHVALRVYDAEKGTYDKVYDFGRYDGQRGLGGSQGPGILNVYSGEDYFNAQSRARDQVAYQIETSKETDMRMMKHYQDQINAGTRREDLEKYGRKSYRLAKDYDAAPIFGIGRNTCVTKSAEGLKKSNVKILMEDVADALDQLYPEDVENNLEELFKQKKSPIKLKRIYEKGKSKSAIVITHDKAVMKTKEKLKKEEEEREKSWEEK